MRKWTACCVCGLFISTAATAQSHPQDTLPRPNDSPEKHRHLISDKITTKLPCAFNVSPERIADIISAENVAQSSDLSVADITRRVNGLSVTMDHSGQSDLTIIRGIDPKYNYTLVDGIKIPSPGDRSRYVSLAMFPAGMIDRIEVYKSLTPSMEGDAIGGVVNLLLRDAPKEPILKLRLSTGFNDALIGQSYLSFDNHVVQKESPYQLHGPGYAATGDDFTKANLYFTDRQAAPDLMGSLNWGRR